MATSVNEPTINHSSALKRSIFLGLFGVDRFYLGDKGLGTAKLVLTICTFGIYCVPWWIADIIIIANHKSDWKKWLADKQAKREAKHAQHQRVAVAQVEGRALMAERKHKGLCTACGSDKIQAITETNSSARTGTLLMRMGSPSKHYIDDKISSKTMIVCLSCGFRRPL